jgi:hypothetical protein
VLDPQTFWSQESKLRITDERLRFAKSAEYSLGEDIRRFGTDVYLKDGTLCDVVVLASETQYVTKNGLVIYHNGLFSLDTFPDYYPDLCVWKYHVPLYYKGSVRYMSRNVGEKLVYPINHKFESPVVQVAFDQIIATCLRIVNATTTFSKMVTNMGVLVSQGAFQTRGALDDYLRVVCDTHNPCYVFGFDKCAPHDNIGFTMPMFMVHYIEFKKWIGTIDATNKSDERQYAGYIMYISSVTGCSINYASRMSDDK